MSAPAPEFVVQLDHVAKSFDDVVAVNDVSMLVGRGTVLGVIGPSGAGKTTTIRMISGGLYPDTGFVRVLGEDPRHFRRRTREAIGYMQDRVEIQRRHSFLPTSPQSVEDYFRADRWPRVRRLTRREHCISRRRRREAANR